jgi:hypothetical protein
MIDWTNPVRNETEHAESISNHEEMIRGYYKLAEYYRQIAMHREAINYYSKLFRTQTSQKTIYQRSQFFSTWAQELYFDNDWNGLSKFLLMQVFSSEMMWRTRNLLIPHLQLSGTLSSLKWDNHQPLSLSAFFLVVSMSGQSSQIR